MEGAQILGVSTDSKFSHLAWVNQELGELKYPLLADFTKQVSKDYGVLLEKLGSALRGTFIIDPNGLVRAYIVQDLTVGRSVDEILRLVSALKTGEALPRRLAPRRIISTANPEKHWKLNDGDTKPPLKGRVSHEGTPLLDPPGQFWTSFPSTRRRLAPR